MANPLRGEIVSEGVGQGEMRHQQSARHNVCPLQHPTPWPLFWDPENVSLSLHVSKGRGHRWRDGGMRDRGMRDEGMEGCRNEGQRPGRMEEQTDER